LRRLGSRTWIAVLSVAMGFLLGSLLKGARRQPPAQASPAPTKRPRRLPSSKDTLNVIMTVATVIMAVAAVLTVCGVAVHALIRMPPASEDHPSLSHVFTPRLAGTSPTFAHMPPQLASIQHMAPVNRQPAEATPQVAEEISHGPIPVLSPTSCFLGACLAEGRQQASPVTPG
jgi:hypothetical protein